MLLYVARRILLMIPTLLGITMVTFLLVMSMPGKPGEIEEARRKGVNPEELEAQRRRYFLDLPLFWNTSVEDGPAAIGKVIDRTILPPELSKEELISRYKRILTEEEQKAFPALSNPELVKTQILGIRERGLKSLMAKGGAAVPVAFARLDDLAASITEEELDQLFAALTQTPAPQEHSGAKERWKAWWEQNRSRYTREHVEEYVERYLEKAKDAQGASAQAYLRAADPEATMELRKLGTFAIGPLIRVTQDTDYTDREVGAAASLLSEITRVSYTFAPEVVEKKEYEEIDKVIAGWKEWWKQYRRDYEEYTTGEKILGFITETQYFKWLARIATFEFGLSQVQIGRPVLDILKDALPPTIQLAFLSLFLSYIISIPIGVFSAKKQGSVIDQIITVVLFILYSLPSFSTALLLILLFCGQGIFDWFPVLGLESQGADQLPFFDWLIDRIWHMVLPVFCLTYGSLASLSRYQRVGMLDVIRQDYIRTARAKGLSERVVIWKHAFRNSLLPVITLLGLQIPFLVGGSVIVEEIFQINGMGREIFKAISTRDYPVVMAATVLTAIATMLALLLSDILYAVADPRISYKEK